MKRETKTCVSPEYGGCGRTKGILAFQRDRRKADGTMGYRPKCKDCINRMKKLSAEERAKFKKVPNPGHNASNTLYTVHFCEEDKTKQLFDLLQLTLTTTCEREYWRIGRACA